MLIYGKNYSTDIQALISIDPSPSLEVKGAGEEEKIKAIPLVYNAMDAGMPTDPMEVMKAMPDIPKEMLMIMKDMLGPESGLARRDRKRGISVPRESLTVPTLFIGAELGDSLPFGISLESTQKMADYYNAEFVEIKGASHPGIIMGVHAKETADKIDKWLTNL